MATRIHRETIMTIEINKREVRALERIREFIELHDWPVTGCGKWVSGIDTDALDRILMAANATCEECHSTCKWPTVSPNGCMSCARGAA